MFTMPLFLSALWVIVALIRIASIEGILLHCCYNVQRPCFLISEPRNTLKGIKSYPLCSYQKVGTTLNPSYKRSMSHFGTRKENPVEVVTPLRLGPCSSKAGPSRTRTRHLSEKSGSSERVLKMHNPWHQKQHRSQ